MLIGLFTVPVLINKSPDWSNHNWVTVIKLLSLIVVGKFNKVPNWEGWYSNTSLASYTDANNPNLANPLVDWSVNL